MVSGYNVSFFHLFRIEKSAHGGAGEGLVNRIQWQQQLEDKDARIQALERERDAKNQELERERDTILALENRNEMLENDKRRLHQHLEMVSLFVNL